jgi:Zn-dependent protease with chaperone function
MSRIIICFRAEDASDAAHALYAALLQHFDPSTIVAGVDQLVELGDDYVEAIQHKVGTCAAMLVVVGPGWHAGDWLAQADHLDSMALRVALATNRRLIPILVNGGSLAGRLPGDFSRLGQKAAITLTEANFTTEVARLVPALQKAVDAARAVPSSLTPAGATLPTAPPPAMPIYEPVRREQILGRERVILKGIDSVAFQHPWDKLATENLRKLRGFDMLVGKVMEFGVERLQYFVNMANAVRVTPRQFAPLDDMLEGACRVLDMPMPELYVYQSPLVNALTYGHNRPYIVLYSGLLDMMSDQEIFGVIAHECGHIKCGHVLYRTMALSIGDIMALLGSMTLGIGELLGMGIKIAMMNWYRRSELSADRAALLVLQDPVPCISMLAKLAGGTTRFSNAFDPAEFLEQARRYEENNTNLDKFYRVLMSLDLGTHPFPIERAKHLNEWIDSPEYDQILAGNFARQLQIRGGKCPTCDGSIAPGDRFCSTCGRPTGGLE